MLPFSCYALSGPTSYELCLHINHSIGWNGVFLPTGLGIFAHHLVFKTVIQFYVLRDLESRFDFALLGLRMDPIRNAARKNEGSSMMRWSRCL
ncbi:hypothetical protein DL98DRAFT_509996, partial [Cadophora sp. DSE1049]